MKMIKLTKADGRSKYGNVRWAAGATVSLPKEERHAKLCEKGLLHVYVGKTIEHALALGLMMDPEHAGIGDSVRAFEVRGELVARDSAKAGGWCFRVGDEIEVTLPTREQRVRFAIYCAQAVAPREACSEWWQWAERWLDGSDRSERLAQTAWEEVEAAVRAVWWAAQAAAEAAAWCTDDAAETETAWAAQAVVVVDADIDLAELALRAIREEVQP